MDCARMADTVSARDLARGEAGTCTEIARRALGTAWRGRLENKWGIMKIYVELEMPSSEGKGNK
jgi:hypothetical protein